MSTEIEKIAATVVAVDLEVHPGSGEITAAGAYCADREFIWRKTDPAGKSLRDELEKFCQGHRIILGHNIIEHDLKYIKTCFPNTPLLNLDVVDTLLLSPLAFPQNPYHSLWKGYKILSFSLNDPLKDAHAAWTLLQDECISFAANPLTPIYQTLLGRKSETKTCAEVLRAASGKSDLTDAVLKETIELFLMDKGCLVQVALLLSRPMEDIDPIGLAYAVAWLSVAGRNSRLAPWVCHAFPQAKSILSDLREKPCPGCSYCLDNHDARKPLEKYFNFKEFRTISREPPLTQGNIVNKILGGSDIMAILPTGGGKSLCYQLPAIMKACQRNLLTVVFSPLQALMFDQLEGMKKHGISDCGMINGMQTLIERFDTMRQVELGDIDILLAAPEQMRNASFLKMLSQREIGLVVVDEAHCLSKWGHDFRPDYLYICRFLRELVGKDKPLPQIACFTATAKPDVIKDVKDYFESEAEKKLEIIRGDLARDNLEFFVHQVETHNKRETCLGIISASSLGSGEGAIVFSATRNNAEKMAEFLKSKGISAEFFHAGLKPEEKRKTQESFTSGTTMVICATNAFGMGIDKANVRLIIHSDIPGSLEAYLQEAGRAGRDGADAACHLLYTSQDLETQFQLCGDSQITFRDMDGIYRKIKRLATRAKNKGSDQIVKTVGEILNEDDADIETIIKHDQTADTKVKVAIAWLEKAGKLERGFNKTTVIEAKPMTDLPAAKKIIHDLKLPQKIAEIWEKILLLLFESNSDQFITTDRLADETHQKDPILLLDHLRRMRKANLIHHDLNLSAFMNKRDGDAKDSLQRWKRYAKLEEKWLSTAFGQNEGWEPGSPMRLSGRMFAQDLKTATGFPDASINDIRIILQALKADLSLDYKSIGDGCFNVEIKKTRSKTGIAADIRRAFSQKVVEMLSAKIPGKGLDLKVDFTANELESFYKPNNDELTTVRFSEILRKSLLNLHSIGVLTLQNGLTVFRPAITLKFKTYDQPKLEKSAIKELEDYYEGKIAQVHIMEKYAQIGKEQIKDALRMVNDYFEKTNDEFYNEYFKGKKEKLHLPVGEEGFRRIIGKNCEEHEEKYNLSDEQRGIVGAPKTKSILVLAGPGSGKTKTIVHRAAWLVKVARIPRRSLLIVAFNRSAVQEIRRRLKDLLGKDAARVMVYTYHGLAMRLVSGSFMNKNMNFGKFEFSDMLKQSVQMLENLRGDDRDEATHEIIGRLQYLLVDEYQDINDLEYRLISLLARKDEPEAENPVHLMAVGDDDQNIYEFNGSSSRFLKMFESDYKPEFHSLLKNFRSTPQIVDFTNRFIKTNQDRMKSSFEMISSIDGRLEAACAEKPRLIRAKSTVHADGAVIDEIARMIHQHKISPERIAVLAFKNDDLSRIKLAGERAGFQFHNLKRNDIPVLKTREIRLFLGSLRKSADDNETNWSETSLRNELRLLKNTEKKEVDEENPWKEWIDSVIEQYFDEYQNVSPSSLREFIYDFSRETRVGAKPKEGYITLATMHCSKGLEFDGVVVLSDDLEPSEEKRRLIYVAMTRAKTYLSIVGNDLDGLGREIFSLGFPEDYAGAGIDILSKKIVWEMEPDDVYLSFPALHLNKDVVPAKIREMNVGTVGILVKTKSGYEIHVDSVPVCRLSRKGIAKLDGFSGFEPTRIKCSAIIYRQKSEEKPEFAAYAMLDEWEYAIFEFVLTATNKS